MEAQRVRLMWRPITCSKGGSRLLSTPQIQFPPSDVIKSAVASEKAKKENGNKENKEKQEKRGLLSTERRRQVGGSSGSGENTENKRTNDETDLRQNMGSFSMA